MRSILLISSLLLTFLQSFAGGKITGTVSDAKNGETIISAVVVVKGTGIGTTTDIDGNFVLPVEAGTYTIEFKYVGYKTKEISDVKVVDGQSTKVNVVLESASSTELAEVVVKSSLKKENIGALYVLQKNNATISDGISADIIKKSPDRSTGEVLKRVSGTTIQNGKFVVVRGLSDRYNIAIVDGSILPSTEPNRKAFSFDIIPSNVIDNIVISKAGTPDMPGDFAGGIISIHTKEVPEKNFNTITVGTSYNTISTFQPFKMSYKTPTDILGFDNGARQLPSTMPSTVQILTSLTKQQQIAAQSSLNNDYSIHQRSAMPGGILQASLGRSWDHKKSRTGLIAALTYSHNETMVKNAVRRYDNFQYLDNTYRYSTNIGGLVNYGYTAGRMKLVWKNLYNRNFDDNFLFREGTNVASSKYINYYAYDLVQKSLFRSSVEGDFQVGKGQNKLNWVLAYNRITNNQPDQRKTVYFRDSTQYIADISTIGKSNSRFFSNLGENVYVASVNYSVPFKFLNNTSTFKAGGLFMYRHRDFAARYLGMVPDLSSPYAMQYYTNPTFPIGNLYNTAAIDSGAFKLDDITAGSDKYSAAMTTSAGYLMLDNRLSDRARLVWGSRIEVFHVNLQTKLSGNPLTVDTTWTDLLPSANFTYAITEKSNFRASYYHTVARPEMREMAPLAYYDYELSALVNGNPKLARSRIDNADLRYEIFPKNGEVMSGSVFYKHFNNTIENEVYSSGISTFEIKPNNFPSAYNVGVEGDIRKTLGFISPESFMERVTFYTNAAIIRSLVTDTSKGAKDRPLTGQSSYVVNASIGYTTDNGKLNMNVLYNRIGERIYLVGQGGGSTGYLLGNVYERPRNLLDFQATYTVSNKSEFRLLVKDIFNAPYVFFYDQNGNKKFDNPVYTDQVNSAEDYILQKYRPGTSFTLMYTYRF